MLLSTNRKDAKRIDWIQGKEEKNKLFDKLCKRANRRSPAAVRILNTRDQVYHHTTTADTNTYVHIRPLQTDMSLFGDRNSSLDALIHQLRPSAWQQFLDRPCIFLARKFYTWQPAIPAQPLANYVSIVCVSDTHNAQPKLPNRDILIHAGDLTQSGSLHELQKTVDWLRSQPHKTRIVITGNHDLILDARFPQKSDASGDAVD